MPSMFSRTIASLRWTARVTIVLVALWSRCPVLAVLRCPYLDASPVLILSSFRVKEATIRAVVLVILTRVQQPENLPCWSMVLPDRLDSQHNKRQEPKS